MKEAEEFYKNWIKGEGDQDTIIDCLNAFAKQQNKDLVQEIKKLEAAFINHAPTEIVKQYFKLK